MKSQTHKHPTIKNLTGILVLLFIFTLVSSFQVTAQHTVTFGNKSHCDMIVKDTACNNTAESMTVAMNSQEVVTMSDKVGFYEIFLWWQSNY